MGGARFAGLGAPVVMGCGREGPRPVRCTKSDSAVASSGVTGHVVGCITFFEAPQIERFLGRPRLRSHEFGFGSEHRGATIFTVTAHDPSLTPPRLIILFPLFPSLTTVSPPSSTIQERMPHGTPIRARDHRSPPCHKS